MLRAHRNVFLEEQVADMESGGAEGKRHQLNFLKGRKKGTLREVAFSWH